MNYPSGYKVVNEVTSFRDVAALLKTGEYMVLCGTGGWHGTHRTLDDCVRILNGEDLEWLPGGAYITVFLVNPKEVTINWGNVKLKTHAEIAYLREHVGFSLDAMAKSQEGNT